MLLVLHIQPQPSLDPDDHKEYHLCFRPVSNQKIVIVCQQNESDNTSQQAPKKKNENNLLQELSIAQMPHIHKSPINEDSVPTSTLGGDKWRRSLSKCRNAFTTDPFSFPSCLTNGIKTPSTTDLDGCVE